MPTLHPLTRSLTLRLASHQWRTITGALLANPASRWIGPTGRERVGGELRLLARELEPSSPGDEVAAAGRWGEVLLVEALGEDVRISPGELLGRSGLAGARRGTLLQIGVGPRIGLVQVVTGAGRSAESVGALEVAGPELPRWRLDGESPAPGREPAGPEPPERFSRPAGAFRVEVWRRLGGLAIAVVGCGRSGSLLAETLAREGIGRRLILVDPDRLEEGNLDAMVGMGPGDVGESKVELVRRTLAIARPDLEVIPLQATAQATEAMAHLRHVDVLYTTVDRDAPRLAVAHVASAYLRLHIDIGTRVEWEGPRRLMGSSVRLLLPGEGCVRCVGGLRDEDGALEELLRAAEPSPAARRPWFEERAGSLLHLNAQAVGLGVELLAQLVAGAITRSRWARRRWDESSREQATDEDVATTPPCRVCAAAGLGDLRFGAG